MPVKFTIENQAISLKQILNNTIELPGEWSNTPWTNAATERFGDKVSLRVEVCGAVVPSSIF
jgi:hypothetical protein